ncbi:hypothetical protein N9J24_00505 [Bacteroidia bacterium]|nr:hypothetical protein [Bacteroidia bacterium]
MKSKLLIILLGIGGQVFSQSFGVNLYFSKNSYAKGLHTGANLKGLVGYDTIAFKGNSNKSEAILDYGIGISYDFKIYKKQKILLDLNWEQNRISTTSFTRNANGAEIKKSYRLFTPNIRISSQFRVHKSGLYVAPTLFYSRAIMLNRTANKSVDEINPNPYLAESDDVEFSLKNFGSAFQNNIMGYAVEIGLPVNLDTKNTSKVYFSFSETFTRLFNYNWTTPYRGNNLKIGSGSVGRLQFALGLRYSLGSSRNK